MENRYRDAIITGTKILELRKLIRKELDNLRKCLTVDEVLGGCLDHDLLDKAFEGRHVLEYPGVIKETSHVKSKYVCGDIELYLHTDPDKAKGAVIKALLKEINTSHLLRK